jgi:hypothetical protein
VVMLNSTDRKITHEFNESTDEICKTNLQIRTSSPNALLPLHTQLSLACLQELDIGPAA